MRENPNYDADFDPNLLEDGQKIITRKVKKLVKRQNSKGEWIEEVIILKNRLYLDNSYKGNRNRGRMCS
jgi:hypothetical protein